MCFIVSLFKSKQKIIMLSLADHLRILHAWGRASHLHRVWIHESSSRVSVVPTWSRVSMWHMYPFPMRVQQSMTVREAPKRYRQVFSDRFSHIYRKVYPSVGPSIGPFTAHELHLRHSFEIILFERRFKDTEIARTHLHVWSLSDLLLHRHSFLHWLWCHLI